MLPRFGSQPLPEGRVSVDSRTPTSQVGEASLQGKGRPHHDGFLTLGLLFRPSRSLQWGEEPLEHSVDRSLSGCFTESGENSVPLPSYPNYFHPSPCGHRAQRPASTASGQQTGGVCASWRSPALSPTYNRGPSCSCPAPRSPSSPGRVLIPADGGLHSTRTAHLAEAPLNGPHGGPPAGTLAARSWLSSFGGLAQTLPFPRDFLWPPS